MRMKKRRQNIKTKMEPLQYIIDLVGLKPILYDVLDVVGSKE